MNLSKVLKQKRDAEDRHRSNSPQSIYFEGVGGGGQYIDLSKLATRDELASKSDISHVHTFLDLTDVIPDVYVADKIIKVNATSDGLEFADSPSGASGVFNYGKITDVTDIQQDWGGL